MNEQEFDVVISGAGPAGSTCALHLAGSGLKIAIVDKATFPRDKICGGGLSDRALNALKRLPNNVWERFQQECNYLNISGIKLTSPAKIGVRLSCPLEYGLTIVRKEFDNFLIQEVLKCKNIKFFENEKSLSYTNCKENIIVKTNKRMLKAKILLVADGLNSLLVRQSNYCEFDVKKSVVCVQAVYQSKFPATMLPEIELYYPQRCLPFYFWFFPLASGYINIGLGIASKTLRNEKKNAKSVFFELLQYDDYIKQKIELDNCISKPAVALLPVQLLPKRFSSDRVLISGTAARLVDPVTGEGIGNAMLSGEYAAQQIIQAFAINDFSAKGLADYDKKIIKKLNLEFLRNRLLLACFRKTKWVNKGIKKAATDAAFRADAEQMLLQNKMRWRLLNPFLYL